jgi:Flp pilus assembly protein TadD
MTPLSLSRSRLLLASTAIVFMAGCGTTSTNSASSQAVASTGGMNKLESTYSLDPDDAELSLQLAKSFRQEKRYDDAIAVLMRASVSHPKNGQIYSELGKVLIQRGAPAEALSFLNKAVQLEPKDWAIYSAAGVAYDQMSQHQKAQENYETALFYSPGHPTVLSNLGLSYAMVGDLDSAEATLRKASAHRNATETINLNLALVVGLQGKFDEAERISKRELPPVFAERNIAQLQEMLTQPNRWQDMQDAALTSSENSDDVKSATP